MNIANFTTLSDARDNLVIPLSVLLVDEILPSLKDTELRLLLVVLRQTHVCGRERPSAWLTHRELCKRTGRAGEAVSGAIETLSQAGLLCVYDEAGRRLATTCERRSVIGRLFFIVNINKIGIAKSESGKSKTKDINNYKHYSIRFSDTDADEAMKQRIQLERENIKKRLKVIQSMSSQR